MQNFDLFNASTEDIAFANKEQFSEQFLEWLPENHHIWIAFEAETFKVIKKGFKHYSARTIVEVLRHHSALAENADSGWKINNNITPYLSRLFALMNPQHTDFFEFRHVFKPLQDGHLT